MGKEIIARGQAVVVCQKDGYTINQSVGEYIFNALNNGTIPSAVTVVSTIKVTSGDNAVTNFTIGTINKPTGFASINANNTNKTITYTVAANTTTLADSGTIPIPIIIEGNTYTVSFKWAKSKNGQNGSDGKPGTDGYTVSASRNSYVISTDKDGKIHTAVTTNTTISILKGSTPVTPTIGALPTVAGCTLSKSGATVTIVFNVGTSLAENGTISIPVVAEGKSFAVSFSYAKARAGAAGADSNMLDWVKDWNNNKTQINENSVITPKIFAGTKNSNGTLTGIAIGKFPLSVLNSSGAVTTETINGIYGFKDGYKTFYVDNTGDAGLGRGNQFIRYNATTGKIEFGSDVSLNWTQPIETINTALGGKVFPKLTYIDGKGIYTGTLTAEQVNAVNINASSIKTGTLSADRIAAGSINASKIAAETITSDKIASRTITADKIRAGAITANEIKSGTITSTQLDANSIKANIINTAYIQGLILNFTKGTIGGWTIDGDSIFRGTKSNTSGTYTSASGAITIGSNGIRGFKWKLDSSGAGALAGGNILWDASGNVTFGSNVSLNWTNAANNALNSAKSYADTKKTEAINSAATTAQQKADAAKNAAISDATNKVNALKPQLTKIDANGIYTGTINASQITAGTINAGRIDVNALKSSLITAGNIEALTLNIGKGKIGGWNISGNAISKNSVSLGSDGSITNGTKWKLNNDGSGQLANGNIKWDILGNIIFSSSGLGDIANQGEIYVRGSSYQYAKGSQLYINGKEILINSKWWRSFCLIIVSRNDLSVVSIAYYDTYAGEGNTCNELASVLDNVDSNKLVILISNDAITVNDTLNNAIKKCGGKDWTGNGKRSAYAFIGISGIGENNGISAYKHAERSCVEISTKVINGIPQGFNTGTLTANQINAANCNFTQGKIGGFTIYGHKMSTYDNPENGHIIEIHKTGYICNSRKSDSKDYWALNADGSATFGITKAVKFNADGSGSVATNGISWNANGVLKVGGFEIGQGRIGSTATQSGGGGSLAIYNDFLRIGSTSSYVLFGNNVFPATSSSTAAGRVVNTISNSYYNNYGIHIDVKNGKRNFGVYSNAPILANACIGNKIKTVYFSSTAYSIDFSQANIFIIYANRNYNISLPAASSVASMFGYSSLPSDFGYMFTFIYRYDYANTVYLQNVRDINGNITSYGLAKGDSIILCCSNYPSFHYQMINHIN